MLSTKSKLRFVLCEEFRNFMRLFLYWMCILCFQSDLHVVL